MRLHLLFLLLLASLLSGCQSPDPGSLAGPDRIHATSAAGSGYFLARVGRDCDAVAGSVTHVWNLTRYNPLAIIHFDDDLVASKLYWGLEYDGAKDLTSPGGVDVSAGGQDARSPALLAGTSTDNQAAFAMKARAPGWVLVLWHEAEQPVEFEMEASCRGGLELAGSGEAFGFKLSDLDGGAHVVSAGPDLILQDRWSSPAAAPTVLMLRYSYADAGYGLLAVQGQDGRFERSLTGEPGADCISCMEEGRILLLDPGRFDLEVTYAGNGRQTTVYGLGAQIPALGVSRFSAQEFEP